MHQMPTIRVIESMKNRKTKMEILRALTSENKHKLLNASGYTPKNFEDKYFSKPSGRSVGKQLGRQQFMTPSNMHPFPDQKITLLNYKTLEELNKEFFVHKKTDSAKMICHPHEQEKESKRLIRFSRESKKNSLKKNNFIDKFAEQPLKIDDMRSSQYQQYSGTSS
jgi:hypothetical protein